MKPVNDWALTVAIENCLIKNVQTHSESCGKDFKKLLNQYSPLLETSVSRYSSNRFWLDDLKQEAELGFHEAIRRYDANKGAPFAPFAKTVINGRLIDFYRKSIKINSETANNSAPCESYIIETDSSSQEDFSQILYSGQNELSTIHAIDFSEANLTKALEELEISKRDQTAFNLYFREDFTLDKVVERLDLPRSTVHRIISHTKDSVIDYYSVDGYKYIYTI